MILKRISSFVYNIYVVILNNLHYSFVRIITRKLHGQGQKRRRRRCTGRVRSASGRQRRLRRGAERIDERIIIQYTSTSIIILLGSRCLPVRSGPPTK